MSRLIILFAVLGAVSCGYTTGMLANYRENRIVIAPAVNDIEITAEEKKGPQYVSFPILLEKRLTNTVINKFNIDGHLKVTNDRGDALRLSCTIKKYDKWALRYDSNEEVEEQRLQLYVQMKLVDSQGKTLQDKEIIGETTYFLTGANSKSESSAQTDLIDDTARRILEAVIEAW